MTDAFLILTGVSKRFGEHRALAAVDLDVHRGEFFTLLGPSGCGKSTLLRLIAGLQPADAGTVQFKGDEISALPPELRPFNMVFQSYALFPHLNVAENVAYGLRAHGVKAGEIDSRVARMLEIVGLEAFGGRAPSQLSGGQQQRVALARALVNEPEILLLDEPLSALDRQLRKRLQDELRSIQRRIGTTFIFVTHDQEEALALSHRVSVMKDGAIVQTGSPMEIYGLPANRFVAEFFGDVNLLECEVKGRVGRAINVKFADGAESELEVHPASSLATGDDALAAIRPEHLEVAGGAGGFPGVVADRVFLGDHWRYDIELDSGQKVHLQTSTEAHAVSERVSVRIIPGRGAAIAADSTQEG